MSDENSTTKKNRSVFDGDSPLSPIQFAEIWKAERFVKHNLCRLCLTILQVVPGENRSLHVKCIECEELIYEHSAISKYQAEQIKAERSISMRELRDPKPRKDFDPEAAIRALGFD